MDSRLDIPLIETIKERCRVCYTCVRECPAKAIRIKSGQAEVIEERCIGCGNCYKVCSQRAKRYQPGVQQVRRLFASNGKVAACLAPSFPAEFMGVPYQKMVGALRQLGFTSVHEVGFGADLVADRYRRLLESSKSQSWIATTCPAIVGYVERHHPDLVKSLAPLVSPMIAMARCLKKIHGDDLQVVFIGPCIAKKREANSHTVAGEISAVLTFEEMRDLMSEGHVDFATASPMEFDPPWASDGALFPMSSGLIEAAKLDQGLASFDVVASDGRKGGFEALEEFAQGSLSSKLLESLACKGCIMGPCMGTSVTRLGRRELVAQYVRERRSTFNVEKWRADMESFSTLDLSRSFVRFDQRLEGPSEAELTEIMCRMGKFGAKDELNCGACGYDTCREHAKAIHAGLAELEMCLPFTIEYLRRAVSELAISHEKLATAREALMHAERLASMGQLAAGIAHEVNNPLGIVLVYSHLLIDECAPEDRMRSDLLMIAEQADRCKRIVAGLLNFARQNKVVPQLISLKDLIAHSVRALATPPNVEVKIIHEGELQAELDRDQMTQVLTNLIGNAYDAMQSGGSLTIRTGGDAHRVWLKIADTGVGISPQNMSKLFEPFFTTKPMGKGTGLGLPVTYGIVKMHHGDIQVESNNDAAKGPVGTTFTVILPRRTQQT